MNRTDAWTPEKPYACKDRGGPYPGTPVSDKWPEVEAKIPLGIRSWIPKDIYTKLRACAYGTELVSQIVDWMPGFIWFLCGKLARFPFLVVDVSGYH